jgi:hypothetical protein
VLAASFIKVKERQNLELKRNDIDSNNDGDDGAKGGLDEHFNLRNKRRIGILSPPPVSGGIVFVAVAASP